jgi:hypothetical protein
MYADFCQSIPEPGLPPGLNATGSGSFVLCTPPYACWPVSIPPAAESYLYRDPNDTDDHIQALAFSPLVLEAPHPVGFLIPICSCCAMHPSASNVGLSIRASGSLGIGFCRRYRGVVGRSRFVKSRGGHEMLYDGAVDGVFERWSATRGRRFRDQGAEDRVLRRMNLSERYEQRGWSEDGRTIMVVFHDSVFECS